MTALALCRFLHYMAAMLTFGLSAYLSVYAPERLKRALTPAARPLALIASIVALLTAIVWLQLTAASMAGDLSAAVDPGLIGLVLTSTEFGHVWAAHLCVAAALVAVIVLAPRAQWAATAIAAAALLASLGPVGHAAMQTGVEGVAHRANQAVHLLTAGAWVGGLAGFVMCLRTYQRDDLKRDSVKAMTAFSFYGHFIVAGVVLTGVVNIALTSGHPPIPPTTLYQALLLAKIILVAMMISFALFNRYVLTPRLKPRARALALLRVTSASEIALGSVVVALVSVFGLLNPA